MRPRRALSIILETVVDGFFDRVVMGGRREAPPRPAPSGAMAPCPHVPGLLVPVRDGVRPLALCMGCATAWPVDESAFTQMTTRVLRAATLAPNLAPTAPGAEAALWERVGAGWVERAIGEGRALRLAASHLQRSGLDFETRPINTGPPDEDRA